MRTSSALAALAVVVLSHAAAYAQDGYLGDPPPNADGASEGEGAGDGYLPGSAEGEPTDGYLPGTDRSAEDEGYLPDGQQPDADTLAAMSSAAPAPTIEIGFWAGPDVNTTFFGGEPTVMMGGVGAVVVNHNFALGGAGWGSLIDLAPPDNYTSLGFDPGTAKLAINYGGATLEGLFFDEQIVSLGVRLLLGGGQAALLDPATGRSIGANTARFFAAEFSADAAVNITSYFRVRAGAGYRLAAVNEADWIDNRDLFGPTVHVGLIFGWF